MYKGKRQTSWHYDGHDNFLYVLKGQKIVYIAHPQNIEPQSTFSTFNNHIKKMNRDKNPKNIFMKTKIRRGECLFIPKGWWHAVNSSGKLNIAINYWGNSVS